jgi:starch synthase
MKVLFVTSEAYPLIKTGGLGDVCGSLPPALLSGGVDVRLLLPGYPSALASAGPLRTVAELDLRPFFRPTVRLLEGRLPGTRVRTWLIDCPPAYDRAGNPYHGPDGRPWPDNAERFALLARAAVALALGRTSVAWRPDIVHANDWQTGLVPALLAAEPARPATVFTIHNLAYQGLFPRATFDALRLDPRLWTFEALEFHGQLSFIKGGLAFADRLTTVSPSYAREIQTPESGLGLDGLLRWRRDVLTGILNGIDTDEWNPARDPHLVSRYRAGRPEGKRANKTALQQELGLPAGESPLLGLVGRLVPQKGIDLVLAILPALATRGVQLALLGSGDREYEEAWRRAAKQHAGWLAVRVGYDEGLAHRIEAGADLFLMPSRFEPCGLNQMYSLRYGTVPVVHRVGGLADTVVDADAPGKTGEANGFVFDPATPAALLAAIDRALACYRQPARWSALQRAGLRQDHGWPTRAGAYAELYRELRPDAVRRAPSKTRAPSRRRAGAPRRTRAAAARR